MFELRRHVHRMECPLLRRTAGMLLAIALAIAVSAVVLLIFLFLRRAMVGSGAPPPPADLPAPPAKFTDLREISAYVLAHAAGIAWGATINPWIFRSLIATAMATHS